MDIEKIRQLMELAAASPFFSMEYKEGDSLLRLSRGGAESFAEPKMEKPAEVKAAPAAEHPVEKAAPVAPAAPAVEEQSTLAAEDVVKSPLVGVFYAAPAEGEAPFVSVGSKVKKGQVIGIIETMKLMNELEAEEDGEITAILVENEQVVEFGQPLFRLRPAK